MFNKLRTLYKDVFASIGLYLIYAFITASCSVFIDKEPITLTVAAAIFCFLIILSNINIFKDKFKTIKRDFNQKAFISGIMAIIVVIILNNILTKITGSTSENEIKVINYIKEYPFIFGINAVLIAPLAEELIFRFIYRNEFRITSLIISSLLFSLVHISGSKDAIFLIPYFIMSIGIGINYFKTDNIYISYLIHILNNLINMLLLIW